MREIRTESPKHLSHQPLDCSCVGIDAEDLDLDGSDFDFDLNIDMATMTLDDLSRHYPELTFGFAKGPKRPSEADYTRRLSGGWRVANWRHLAESV